MQGLAEALASHHRRHETEVQDAMSICKRIGKHREAYGKVYRIFPKAEAKAWCQGRPPPPPSPPQPAVETTGPELPMDHTQWLAGCCTLLRGGAGQRIGEHSIGGACIGRPAAASAFLSSRRQNPPRAPDASHGPSTGLRLVPGEAATIASPPGR